MLTFIAPRISRHQCPHLVGGLPTKTASRLSPSILSDKKKVDSSKSGSASRSKSSAIAVVQPMEVFDMLDKNKDGSICKDDFKEAVEQLHYEDLLKLKESLARNELSYNPHAEKEKLEATTHESVLLRRMRITAEVTISKIIPAGCGWQTFATLADNAGCQGTDLSFALATGLGDGLFVMAGHTLWMAGKKAVTGNENINLAHQTHTGLLLGSAAFCSGGIWQPTVNALQDANWSFESSLMGTLGIASLAFFTGLRLSRQIYSPFLEGVEENNYANLEADAQLSLAVGGAAGCFLGTDISYEAANWLRPIVGIEEFHGPITASLIAGSSTGLGFTVVQMGQNFVYPKDKCWVD